MIVDIRYHLASLVAVFFALGLGILVGMSISTGEKGSELREQWMAAIESELEAVRLERKETASRLELALGERDLYKSFAADMVTTLIRGRLAAGRTDVVVFGEPTSSTKQLLEALEQAGATVTSPTIYDAGELDTLSVELASSDAPRRVVAVLSGAAAQYGNAFHSFLEDVRASGARIAAVLDGEPGWRPLLDDQGVDYVTHVDSPPGALSLVLLLASGASGRYGTDPDLPGWPEHLLDLVEGLGKEGDPR